MPTTTFRLDSLRDTQLWHAPPDGLPSLMYWGPALDEDEDHADVLRALAPPVPHGGLDVTERLTWLPEPGSGFTDHPGLVLRRGERVLVTRFRLEAVEPVEGEEGPGWRFSLSDRGQQVTLQLTVVVDGATGVFSAHAALTNNGDDGLGVDWMASITLPVPAQAVQRISFGGQWANEFQPVREPLGSAAWLQESRTGRTSHHAWPGLMLVGEGTSWGAGEAFAAQLAWSGNHRVLLQRCRLGGAQLQLGELLLPGEVCLSRGERHATPVAHFARSALGLRRMSLRLHDFVRRRILPAGSGTRERLVQFNSWEATYFEHDHARTLALAESAAALGAERFVLDDGWFIGRRHDRAGLGDWRACPQRYPQGLGPIAAHCRSLGMEFGLWVEPECVNADSDLYRSHPEWILGRADQPLGRHQYLLDLGREEVRDHLFDRLAALLGQVDIGYLKWDMNRDVTDATGHTTRWGVSAHVNGLYALLGRLRAAFPRVQIESCASGGARADLGVLRHAARIWPSDCNDPLERQSIHAGFLSWLPAEVMGAHVGDARSHTTGRITDIRLRTLAALFGHFGIEADVLSMPEADRHHLKLAVAEFKRLRGWLATAGVTPIQPAHPHLATTLAVAADGAQALLTVVATGRLPPLLAAQRIDLPDHRRYDVSVHPLWPAASQGAKREGALARGERLRLSGRLLRCSGVSLPIPQPGTGFVVQFVATAASST